MRVLFRIDDIINIIETSNVAFDKNIIYFTDKGTIFIFKCDVIHEDTAKDLSELLYTNGKLDLSYYNTKFITKLEEE